MPSLPSATTSLQSQAGRALVATDLCAIIAPCVSNADGVPVLHSATQNAIDENGYSEGIEYLGLHIDGTDKAALLVPVPIATAGAMRWQHSVHTGTAKVTAAVGSDGALAKITRAIVKVTRGGTVGTDQIILSLSLDEGRSYKPVRLGTATSYTVPRIGVVLSFLSGGTLVADDTVLEFSTTGPMFDADGIALALAGLKAQQLAVRSWLCIGEVSTGALGQSIESAANSYATTKKRFVAAKFHARDRRKAESSRQRVAMTGTPALTFAEVGATGDTITRATGSWVTDGFQAGDYIRVTGSVSNNIEGKITAVTATVLTLDTVDLAAEVLAAGDADIRVTAEPSVTIATGPDTLTRNRGSWITDGFAVGDVVTVAGLGEGTISVLTATVMTFSDLTLPPGIDGAVDAVISFEESETDWMAAIEDEFDEIDDSPRVDIGAGYGRKLSTITNYTMRWPWQWADHVESYRRDLSRTTWEKDKGPLDGWSIEGEHDEDVTAGLIAGRFTCARTWPNGPAGAFTAISLTRATDGDVLGMTHNMYVANLVQTIVQRETEGFAGRVIPLNADGTAKPTALADLEAIVNRELARNLLVSVGGGPARASAVNWRAATNDVLNVADATLNGVCTLNLNGTIVHVNTIVRVS